MSKQLMFESNPKLHSMLEVEISAFIKSKKIT
jgi:hypothetical protein